MVSMVKIDQAINVDKLLFWSRSISVDTESCVLTFSLILHIRSIPFVESKKQKEKRDF